MITRKIKKIETINKPGKIISEIVPKTTSPVIMEKTQPKYYFVSNINYYLKYIPSNKERHYFYKDLQKQGQLKLLLNEIRFFSEDLEIHNFKEEDFILLYIGSGKGYHIPVLIDMYKKYKIKWILYDPSGHCDELIKLSKEIPSKLVIYNTLFTDKDIEDFIVPKNYKFIFISDIRSVDDNATEPTTSNLLFDYKLQNNIITKLNPDFSLVKFRMPFPDQWNLQVFYKPVGKEYIQAFTKNNSTEFRIFLNSLNTFQRISNIKSLIKYEELFSWYNNIYRFQKKNDLLIAIHILNLYNKVEKNTVEDTINISNILIHLKKITDTFN